jgi:hypothetical protein
VSTAADQHAEGARADGAYDAAPRDQPLPWGEVLAAGVGLVAALKRTTTALAALLVAEARVTRASIALAFLGGVALIACAVSLWVCVVVLVGWGLSLATHSFGAALGILVLLHLLLVVALWLLLKRVLRQAALPVLRKELRAVGGELRQHVERLHRATPRSGQEPLA